MAGRADAGEGANGGFGCVPFLQDTLPRLALRWPGFRRVRGQVCKRIRRRAAALGLDGYAAYRRYLDAHAEEWAVLDSLCRISISRFRRDRGVFDRLAMAVLPRLADEAREGGTARVCAWSAGCASGEEPYSLAIVWAKQVAPRHPAVGIDILATDVDPVLLERARQGVYGRGCLKELPPEWIAAAFTPANGKWRIDDSFRRHVGFFCQDIRHTMPEGPFDLVLCRNLAFTYFEERLQRTILRGIAQRLRPGGVLVTGRHERLPDGAAFFAATAPGSSVYLRIGDEEAAPWADDGAADHHSAVSPWS